MGRIEVALEVQNGLDPTKRIACTAVVDTGAYCLTLPMAWRERLGEFPHVEDVDLELADQRVVRGKLCSPVRLEVPGLGVGYGMVLLTEMAGPDGRYEPLLGYLALEELRVAVDLVQHRLVKLPYVDLKSVAA